MTNREDESRPSGDKAMNAEKMIDSLAQEIRRVDGNHSLGAGALAEALAPFIRSLTPDPAVNAGAVVKALEWEGPTQETNGCHVARCIFGTYSAVNEQGWYVMLDDHPWGQSFEWSAPDMRMTFDDAAKAAQADYERRILSALTPQGEETPAPQAPAPSVETEVTSDVQ